jgi:YidC/Oxa1 family membrane protein insertase
MAVALVVVAACAAPSGSPGASGSPAATPIPPAAIPLRPAEPTDPFNLLAWLFTPLYQTFFIALVLIDQAVRNMAITIIVMTVILRALLIPIFRKQMVSARRMQMLAPELKEITKRFKGDRLKAQEAQRQLYAERGINPLSGCLPLLLSALPLIPLYSVFSQGLSNYDPQAMMDVFGFRILELNCPTAPIVDASGFVTNPCLDPRAFGIDWSRPLLIGTVAGFGISALGLFAGLLVYLQSRIALPAPGMADPNDPNQRVQRQMALLFPLIYVFFGGTWPAGLLLYIIVSTIFSVVQQYFIIGWGGMFPLFGWTPGFAKDHTPRFPVELPPPIDPATRPPKSVLGGASERRAAAADKTIRHRERGRQSRRGRRR